MRIKQANNSTVTVSLLWVLFALVVWTAGWLHATEPHDAELSSQNYPKYSSSLPDRHPGLERVSLQLRARERLESLLSHMGMRDKERRLWSSSIWRHFALKQLGTGAVMDLYFAPMGPGTQAKKELKIVELELDQDRTLMWKRQGDTVIFSERQIPYQVEWGSFAWKVEKSIFEDGRGAGVEPELLAQLKEIFQDEIDFERGIQEGAVLKLFFEKKLRIDRTARPKFRILAAEVAAQGQHYHALYFEQERGRGHYYNLQGESLLRAFLRFPLEFTRLTSAFSDSRLHPVLKVPLPHRALDFAAARGTPVRAVGDGVVVHAGWKMGGLGRTVEIRHDGGFASRYAHLKSYAPEVRKDVSVTKGQVIGYVGASGRATGPHLHLEFFKDEQQIDLMSVHLPAADRIKPFHRPIFEDTKRFFLRQLETLSDS